MLLKAREFRPRTGPHSYRIVQPWRPLRHTTLNDPLGDRWGYLLGDHDGLSRLAALFSFAAFSRHTIVHVPLRDSLPRAYAPGVPVDLVLAHRSPGLRPSAWPGLRAKLRTGTPLTVRTNEARTAAHAAVWHEEWERRHRRATEWLRPAVHAHTLFLLGGRDVFSAAATAFETAAGFGPLQKRARKGHDALVASLTPYLEPHGQSWDRTEIDIGFQAHPPPHRFRSPGPSASRRCRTGASA
ncbi:MULTISPECIES: hypothetical protein [Streptomyces]|uniref:hypothetical protein n=1 Tax=Streptomyces TaxID=1883 RepID=UPI0013187CE1|nr:MULTISPECIES: hypothetical protein [Streptomyces]QGZ50409.1 hypothetical protein GPZ77_20405 [Streptomyces sp. QHH-9511]GGT88230.1 hypothetical protein GCM10010272_36280 [Streptomyces lateritius]